jgi:RNA polymerase sigma-70 factor (sigma-E family)
MSVEVEFDEFVRVRSGRLLRTAYALTRDHARAEDLLQTALARCWGAWRRIEGDPEPYVRRSLVNTYNSWWQRRWRDEVPTETLPDQPQDGAQIRIDDRDEVWRALGQLPRQQRTVLVLRYFEDMTEAQVAEALGVSVGTVKSTASKGLARLRTDPGVLEFAMPQVPAGTERVAAVHERVTARRRSRIAMAGAAVAVVLALLAGYAIAHRPDRTHPVRPTPSPTTSPMFAIPQYVSGDHTLNGKILALTSDAVVLEGDPLDPGKSVHLGCFTGSEELSERIDVKLAVEILETSGWRSGSWTWGGCGVVPGDQRFTYSVRMKGRFRVHATFWLDDRPLAAGVLPAPVTVWAATAEPVAWESFPFPARPSPLPEIVVTEGAVLTSANWHTALVGKNTWWHNVCLHSQTPGLFHLTVDGKEVSATPIEVWDYEPDHGHCVELPELTATSVLHVSAEHATGAWYVEVTCCYGPREAPSAAPTAR